MMFFDASGVESEASVATGPKRHFSFLLLPSFSPMDVNMAIEALWEANAAGATPCYTWSIHTETGEPLPSRSGVSISVSGDFNDLPHDASLVICGGNRIDDNGSSVAATPSTVCVSRRSGRVVVWAIPHPNTPASADIMPGFLTTSYRAVGPRAPQ